MSADVVVAAGATSPAAAIFEIQHNAPDIGSSILRAKAQFGAHLQHCRVFDQHIAIDTPQTFCLGVVNDTPHQQPAEPVSLESRAYQDRKFLGLFIELVLQTHEPEHVTGIFIKRDKSHFVPVVEMTELFELGGAELGDARKEAKPQILGADIAQKVRIQRHVLGPHPADQHRLAALKRLAQFAQPKIAGIRHRCVCSHCAGVNGWLLCQSNAAVSFDCRKTILVASQWRPGRVSAMTRYAPGGDKVRCSEKRRYSITSSAVASSVCGTVRPSPLAVLRLITSSNLVGCSIGRSDGLSPLRMRAA